MGLKQLLSDLSADLRVNSTISDSGNSNNILQQDNGHTINFKQRSIPWPDRYKEGRPLITFGFDGKEFANVGTDENGNSKNPKQSGDLSTTETSEFMRGGAAVGIARRGQDFVRIGAWMFGTPEGAGWITKQVGLQFSNPRLNAPQVSLGDSLSNQVVGSMGFGGIKDPNQQIYNAGINTTLSTLIAGMGAIPREGLIPYMHSGYIDAGIKKSQWDKPDSIAGDKNRMTFLFNNKIKKDEAVGFGATPFGEAVGNIMSLLTGNEGTELFSYIGGPKSLFGIGRTSHGRYVVSNKDNYGNELHPLRLPSERYSKFNTDIPTELYSITQPPNFIQFIDGNLNRYHSSKKYVKGEEQVNPYFNYNKKIGTSGTRTYHIEKRLNQGSPGKIISPVSGSGGYGWNQNINGTINYRAFNEDKVDKLSALDVFKSDDGDYDSPSVRDLIKFRIEAIDNDSPSSALSSDVMVFRAFLDDLSDNFAAEHNTFKYNGRAEEFYTYKGFKRNIDLSFKIAAQSRHEMMPLYRKLNFLVSNTAPDYSDAGRIRTPYIRLTVGSWMNRIPGVLSGVSLSWKTDYPWEINIDGPEMKDTVATKGKQHMLVLPHMLDVKMSFLPIHNFLPKKGIDTPFILPTGTAIDATNQAMQKWLTLPIADDLATATNASNKKSTTRFE